MPTRTAVLGAGALGLTVALRLAQRGDAVTVIEREPLPGGLAAGFEIEPGMWLEKFYHHLFRSDRRAIAMIEELGLGDRLEWKAAGHRDPPRRPPPPARLAGLAHALLAAARGRSAPHGRRPGDPQGDAESAPAGGPDRRGLDCAAGWAAGPTRSSGSRSCAASSARPRRRSRCPGSGRASTTAPSSSATCAAASSSSTSRLSDAIRHAGGETRYGTAVTSVRTDGDALLVETDAGAERFDRVVSTLATRLTARLVPELPQAWRDRHEWGRAYGAHCVVLALDRPLTSAYWLNMNDPGYPVHGPRRAHELHAARRLRRPPPRLPRQLPADGRPAHDRLARRRPRRVPAAPGTPEPRRSIAPG